jgi:hypothetical protein
VSDAETIVAAAICSGDRTWSLPSPARHRDVILVARRDYGASYADVCCHNQGFLTSAGRFVDRDEALEIARSAKQVDKIIGSVLTSEDLW